MSLHKFAEQVASQGRGDDSLLVHMTPDEVQRLQKFAEANGRTMTINPETGLPEAGFLSDLFKAVAPIALGAFLGPGAFGIAGMGLSAGTAGLITGGITTLATGSLSRGLMAGMGAYGGAGLAQGFMDAGTTALGGAGAETALQAPSVDAFVGNTEGMTSGDAFNNFLKSDANPAVAGKADVFGAGAKAIAEDPMAFAKNNIGNLAAAAAPIAAGMMVPTTTKMPTEDKNPAYIRQKLFDPYTHTYKSLTPVKASEWGNRSFSDAYTQQAPAPTGIAGLQQEQKPMATGGIVALAEGGVPGYAIGGTTAADLEKAYAAGDYAKVNSIVQANQVSAADIQNQWKGLDTSGLSKLGVNLYDPAAEALYKQTGSWDAAAKARDDAANAANTAMWNQQNATKWAADAAAATPNGLQYATSHGQTPDQYYGTIANQFNATTGFGGQYANATDAEIDAAAKVAQQKYGISPADFMKALEKSGGSLAERYAIGAGNMGLSGLNTNINDWIAKARLDPTFKAKTGLQQQQAAMDAMATVNMNEADVKRATGKTIAELFPSTLTKPVSVIPGDTKMPGATVYDNGAYGNYGSGPATGVDYKGNTVSIATPGDIITNPDGSVTVVPNIPGRPYGGFTGMEQVKSRYTAGGGSLGYTPKAPKDMAEFTQMYDKQTGDSMAAYEFLMGKAGSKYPIQSRAAATGINRPYWTDGMRYKPKFLSYDKDGNVVTSTTGGKPADTDAAKTGESTKPKTIDIVDSSGYNTETYTAVLQDDGSYLAGNGKRYDASGKQLSAEGGMMGYAMGGGLGSLGSYSDGGRLLKGPGDGVSDSIPATIGAKGQPARLADGEFVIPARIVSELGNGSTDAGAKKLYAMMDRVQRARGKTTGKNKVAANSRADKYLPA